MFITSLRRLATLKNKGGGIISENGWNRSGGKILKCVKIIYVRSSDQVAKSKYFRMSFLGKLSTLYMCGGKHFWDDVNANEKKAFADPPGKLLALRDLPSCRHLNTNDPGKQSIKTIK